MMQLRYIPSVRLRQFAVLTTALALLVGASALRAQQAPSTGTQTDPPTAVIITYRANPGKRAAFRKTMSAEGIAQLNRWQSEGVFESYNAVFSSFASDASADMFLILRFQHFTDLGKWESIEATQPGGLPEDAQALASVDSSAVADIVNQKASGAPTRTSQYFVLEYDVVTDMPRYTSYVAGYIVPQFDAWMKAGILVSYSSYINQNPAGAPWSSFILLEYKDLQGLSAREFVKNKARADLSASNPVWKKWSDDKTAIRKEKTAIPALALP